MAPGSVSSFWLLVGVWQGGWVSGRVLGDEHSFKLALFRGAAARRLRTHVQKLQCPRLLLTHARCAVVWPLFCVKSTSPTTENWLRKLCTYSMNNNTSDEDKHDTNYINNKCNDTNTDTRKLHNMRARHLERAVSLHLLMSVSHAPHGSRCS